MSAWVFGLWGALLGVAWFHWVSALRIAKLSVRRELRTAHALEAATTMLATPSDRNYVELGRRLVVLSDEISTQDSLRRWNRIPPIERDWPNPMLTPLVTKDE